MTVSKVRSFTSDEARRIGEQIGVIWLQSAFDVGNCGSGWWSNSSTGYVTT